MTRTTTIHDRYHITDSPLHVCTVETCPIPGSYYVTAIDADRWWKMSGPYSNHAAALADVDETCKIATDRHPYAWFYKWGTARMMDADTEPGNLQKAGLLTIQKDGK